MRRIVIAVDPAITSGDDSDETGIIVVAEGPHYEVANGGIICQVANCKNTDMCLMICLVNIRQTVGHTLSQIRFTNGKPTELWPKEIRGAIWSRA